jgi:hypothetical protein
VAPLQVTALIRVLDAGAQKIDRVWRLSRAVDEDRLLLHRDLPYEAGRPVRVELTLPDDDTPLAAIGRVEGVAPSVEEERLGEHARPRAIVFTSIADADRVRLTRYVTERLSS